MCVPWIYPRGDLPFRHESGGCYASVWPYGHENPYFILIILLVIPPYIINTDEMHVAQLIFLLMHKDLSRSIGDAIHAHSQVVGKGDVIKVGVYFHYLQ